MSERIVEDLAIFLPGSKVKELLQARLEEKQKSHAFYCTTRDEHNQTVVQAGDDALVRDKSMRIDDMIKTLDKHVRLFEFWLRYLDAEATYRITPGRSDSLAMLGIKASSYEL